MSDWNLNKLEAITRGLHEEVEARRNEIKMLRDENDAIEDQNTPEAEVRKDQIVTKALALRDELKEIIAE